MAFSVQAVTIKEAGPDAGGAGQSLRVDLTLSDQNGEQPATESVVASVMADCRLNQGYLEVQRDALLRAKKLIDDQLNDIVQRRGKP
jgi:hypothetical protein